MSFGKKLKEFLFELGEAVRYGVDPGYLERQVEADLKRFEQEDGSEAVQDGHGLVRIREVLREKGFSDAALGIDVFDAYYIRTGKVHPLLRPTRELLSPSSRLA